VTKNTGNEKTARKPGQPGREAYDLKGFESGCLRAIRPTKERKGKCVVWLCRCEESLGGCGKYHRTTSVNLRRRQVKSCGCGRGGISVSLRQREMYGTVERNQYIKEALEAGTRNTYELAMELGISRQRVCSIANNMGVSPKEARKKHMEERLEAARQRQAAAVEKMDEDERREREEDDDEDQSEEGSDEEE
jgi:hypothetical protein